MLFTYWRPVLTTLFTVLVAKTTCARGFRQQAVHVDGGGNESPNEAYHSLDQWKHILNQPASKLSEAHEEQDSPHLGSAFSQHFYAQTAEPSTYLYNLFKPSQNDSALAYAVTQTSPSSFYKYLLSSEHADYVHMTPIDEDDFLMYKTYLRPYNRRSGQGSVALNMKYAGWRVSWRGAELEIYAANWIENSGFGKSQTHVIVRSLPTSLTPPVPVPISAKTPDQDHSANSGSKEQAADQATSLFILEVAEFSSNLREVVWVFNQGWWAPDYGLWQSVQKASWDDVVLSDEMKASLKHEYESFYSSEKLYKDLGVPWKRGVIFLGPPGNGKTISLKAIMKSVDVPLLYVKSFKSWMGDEGSIREIFQRARQEAPCLLIFEDLDSLIDDANRSFFLNEVDGLEDNDGLLLIGTTNHFDRLDPALSNRPSRFDRKYIFPNPNKAERLAYGNYWHDKLHSNDRITFPADLAEKFADKTKGFSFAYMKEAFISALIILANDESHKLQFPETLMKQVESLRKELDQESVRDMEMGTGIGKADMGFVVQDGGSGFGQRAMSSPMTGGGGETCFSFRVDNI